MPTAEEASACRERGGVGSLEDQVAGGVDHRSLTPSGCPPEEEDNVFSLAVDRRDHFVGKRLPA